MSGTILLLLMIFFTLVRIASDVNEIRQAVADKPEEEIPT